MPIKRIRGRALQNIRRRHLSKQPLCVMCEAKGLVRAGLQVDHIVPLFKGGQDVPSNRQSLCVQCHADKTAQDLGQRVRAQYGSDGFPV